jgi:hypothetical protein
MWLNKLALIFCEGSRRDCAKSVPNFFGEFEAILRGCLFFATLCVFDVVFLRQFRWVRTLRQSPLGCAKDCSVSVFADFIAEVFYGF